eukprot:s634_g13.t1
MVITIRFATCFAGLAQQACENYLRSLSGLSTSWFILRQLSNNDQMQSGLRKIVAVARGNMIWQQLPNKSVSVSC